MDDVYCEECKFYIEGRVIPGYRPEGCNHNNNKGTWKSREEMEYAPWVINRNMDCGWFELKNSKK